MANNGEKVVLITGGSSGIGAATAEHLASLGYKNLALLSRREQVLNQVAEKCKAKGAKNVLVLAKDLLQPAHCQEAIEETVKEFGRLDVLIGNAGISKPGSIADCTLDQWETTFGLHVTANFLLTKHALPHIRKTKGCIVYTSSVLGQSPSESLVSYCASKAALDHFARCVAKDEAKHGVRINVVSPGVILDEMSLEYFKDVEMEETAKKDLVRSIMAKAQPLGRVGEVDEMAKLFAFLISDANNFMTGSNILSDGGFKLETPKSLESSMEK